MSKPLYIIEKMLGNCSDSQGTPWTVFNAYCVEGAETNVNGKICGYIDGKRGNIHGTWPDVAEMALYHFQEGFNKPELVEIVGKYLYVFGDYASAIAEHLFNAGYRVRKDAQYDGCCNHAEYSGNVFIELAERNK
jgi:hypothetical protein